MWKAITSGVLGAWIVAAALIPAAADLSCWTNLIGGFLVLGIGLFMAHRHRVLGALNSFFGMLVAVTSLWPQSPQQLVLGGLIAITAVAAIWQYYRESVGKST